MDLKIITLTILTTSALMVGCNNQTHSVQENMEEVNLPNNPLGWRKLKCGLYINSEGEIGFPSRPDYVFKEQELKGEDKICPNVFLTTIGSEGKLKLSSIIDTNTFEMLGAGFFKDKSNIYNYYAMCDGGYLNVWANDTSDFKILGCCYASYKKKIYHSRSGLMDADTESFRTSDELGPAAKDKNGFFSIDEKIAEEKLRNEMGDDLFEKLKAL